MTDIPSLHGPSRNELPFRWIQSGNSWVYDDSAFAPVTMPTPIPDYTPDELARIEAAERKRARKGLTTSPSSPKIAA